MKHSFIPATSKHPHLNYLLWFVPELAEKFCADELTL
jgi:hypothetical protein